MNEQRTNAGGVANEVEQALTDTIAEPAEVVATADGGAVDVSIEVFEPEAGDFSLPGTGPTTISPDGLAEICRSDGYAVVDWECSIDFNGPQASVMVDFTVEPAESDQGATEPIASRSSSV